MTYYCIRFHISVVNFVNFLYLNLFNRCPNVAMLVVLSPMNPTPPHKSAIIFLITWLLRFSNTRNLKYLHNTWTNFQFHRVFEHSKPINFIHLACWKDRWSALAPWLFETNYVWSIFMHKVIFPCSDFIIQQSRILRLRPTSDENSNPREASLHHFPAPVPAPAPRSHPPGILLSL